MINASESIKCAHICKHADGRLHKRIKDTHSSVVIVLSVASSKPGFYLTSSLNSSSDSVKEVQAEGRRDVQCLEAQSRGGVWEEHGEHLFGVHQELRRVVPLLETALDVTNEGYSDSFFKLIQIGRAHV